MAGLYRAYGQIRRGSNPWRTPFLIPIGDLEPPFIQGSSNVAIDTHGTAPDLRLAVVLQSVDQYPTLGLQFRVQPVPGRILKDVTLRMVLLKSGDSPFLDSGPLETGVSFVVLHYRVGPTGTFPPEVRIDLNSGVGADDFDSVAVGPPNAPESFPSGHRRITTDRVVLSVVDAPTGWAVDVAGGIVAGDMVSLSGVETDYNSILNTGYVEHPANIRGIALDRLETPAPPGATLPTKATWFQVQATPTVAVPPGQSRQIVVDLRTPTRGDGPTVAPTLTTQGGGSLRIGSYRYSTAFVHKNGNESGASPRSGPVEVTDPTKRSVQITGLPPTPPTPNPDPTNLEVMKVRIYRTDCDQSVDPMDSSRGDRGEEVLIAELPAGTTTYTDSGPADPTAEPTLHDDFMAVRYWSSREFDLNGSMRMLDGPTDTSYLGSVGAAPEYLKVIYRPGASPKLRWVAPSVTSRLGVELPSMELPYGTGLAASVESVPTKLCLDWRILGSEFTSLAVAGDIEVDASSDPDPAVAPSRLSVRIGGPSVPLQWPDGEPESAVELADLSTGSAMGLVSLKGLRRAGLTIGSSAWASRDAEMGHLRVGILFTGQPPVTDRQLRLAYRHGTGMDQTTVAGSAHFVPTSFDFDARLADGSDKVFNLASRLRFVRSELSMRAAADPTAGTRVSGHAFVDDTTDALMLKLGASDLELATKWPVRAGAGLRVESDPPLQNSEPIALWADMVIPASLTSTTSLPLELSAIDPGLSGRAAVAWGTQNPLALRANPQVKVLTNGTAEPEVGVRAVSARVLGLASATIPADITAPFGANPPPSTELAPFIRFTSGRANSSLRFEMQQVESRVPTPPDLWSVDPARSWLRSRTALLPDSLEPHLLWAQGSLAGLSLKSSERWGDGVVWAEPRLARSENTGELGSDQGVGILTSGFDGVPANIEFWMLAHAGVLGSRIADSDKVPSVGPVGSDWPPGGVVLRLDDAIRLSHILVALPEDDGQTCRTDDGPDHAVRYGKWFSAISPFVKIEPTTPGAKQLIMWSTKEPAAAGTGAPSDPCSDSGGGDAKSRKSALGWSIQDDSALSMAVRVYELVTPSGVVSPRWWLMPTSDEEWSDDDVHTGIWGLQEEIQTKTYAGTVVLYPKETTDNPFGDWQGGQGQWWLRQRAGLDVPLFLLFGWDIASGDVYMGNVGGGYHMAGTNGIFSTLPKIWTWSYP